MIKIIAIIYIAASLRILTAAPAAGVRLTQVGKWPNVRSGSPSSVAMAGDYAYVAVGYGVQVLEIGQAGNPVPVGDFDCPADEVAISGDLAYITARDYGLQLLNISNPSAPVRLGTLSAQGYGKVVVSGQHAYVATSGSNPGLQIVDVSDPSIPAIKGVYAAPYGVWNISISGSLACITAFELENNVNVPKLQILDVSDPGRPKLLGKFDTAVGVNLLAVVGNSVYLTEQNAKTPELLRIDISDPARPVSRGPWVPGIAVMALRFSGDFAYLLGPEDLLIYDARNPDSPQLAGTYRGANTSNSTNWFADFAVAGRRACVTTYFEGLNFLDVSTLTQQTPAGRYNDFQGWIGAFAMSGNYAFVSQEGGMRTLDVSDRAAVIPTGFVSLGRFLASLVVADRYIYAHYGSPFQHVPRDSGFYVIDISDPARPARVGEYVADEEVACVQVSGKHAYISFYGVTRGLRILDVSDPSNPVPVGEIQIPGTAGSLAVSGNRVYLATEAGLYIVDATDPAKPVLLGSHAVPAQDVSVSGNHAFVALGRRFAEDDDSAGLLVLDVSDPSHPRRVGFYKSSGPAFKLALSGNRACLISGNPPEQIVSDFGIGMDLQVIDVSDLTNPVRIDGGAAFTGKPALDLAITDGHLFLLRGGRLQIQKISDAPRLLGGQRLEGGKLKLPFASVPGNPAAFTLESAATIGSRVNWTVEMDAIITSTVETGLFEATVTPRDGANFYRVKANQQEVDGKQP